MAIGCCNLIIFGWVCEASRRCVDRNEAGSAAGGPGSARRAFLPTRPEHGRARPSRPRPASHRCLRERGENVSPVPTRLRARCLSTNFSSKIVDGSTFEWSFPILTGLLCCVWPLLRTRISSTLTQWRNRVIFCFESREALEANCEWTCVTVRLATWKVVLAKVVPA